MSDKPYRTGSSQLLSVSEVVGINVRAARLARGWGHDRLAHETKRRGYQIPATNLKEIERPRGDDGKKRKVFVDDLVLLALALGVAPLALLAPPPGTWLADRDGKALVDNLSLLGFVDDPVENYPVGGSLLVHGPWEEGWGEPGWTFKTPDDLAAVKRWEKEVWVRGADDPDLPTQEELDRLHEEAIEWPERERLLDEGIRYLPMEDQFNLDLVRGLWGWSGIDEAWRLDNKPLDLLRKWVEKERTRPRRFP